MLRQRRRQAHLRRLASPRQRAAAGGHPTPHATVVPASLLRAGAMLATAVLRASPRVAARTRAERLYRAQGLECAPRSDPLAPAWLQCGAATARFCADSPG
mmetsp:Transcript_111936/g.311110  ORF Transcript_111936/g.311110 Transcript_111936/m.311110 type:complete len:101 (-) Transcript_111936:303-605(-)